jgi:DNA-binding response OmpR family regulator
MKPHVLIVDDSLTVRMDLRATLSAAGFLVTACDTKAAARKTFATRSYALVILDVHLPDGSGIDLLRELRTAPGREHIPIILLSTEAEVRSRIRGLTTGADVYVGKPYDSGYIVSCAQELVRVHEIGPPSSAPTSTGRKILVIDDSPTYLHKLAEVLRQDHHDVVLASSGEEGLALLDVEPVDAILLDLLMPGLDGLEMCRRIRRNPARKHIPIMMMTGHHDVEARYEGMNVGVDEFVVKSPELELLKVRLRSLLRKKRGDSEARDSTTPSARISTNTGLWRQHDGFPTDSLLYRVVTQSGLSSLIGPSTIARACQRAGIDARTMKPSDLMQAMPAIRDTLCMFLAPEEADRRAEAIAALAREACAA